MVGRQLRLLSVKTLETPPTWPDLHARPGHPYYIHAFDWREDAFDIAALHHLCHALNLLGREAYVVGCKVVNPTLKTPILDEPLRKRHEDEQRLPVVVYGPALHGNPLAARVVVRYVLPLEHLQPHADGMGALPEDLVFLDEGIKALNGDGEPESAGTLSIPVFDPALLPVAGQDEPARAGACLYLNHQPQDAVDWAALPPDVEVLSAREAPLLPQALAARLRRASVLYSYERSAVSTLAILCGCPVIHLDGGPAAQRPGAHALIGPNGWAWAHEADALARATDTLPQAAQLYRRHLTQGFWEQLAHWIATTQARADQVEHDIHASSASTLEIKGYAQWRECREPTAERQALLQALLQANPQGGALGVVVFDTSGDAEGLQLTLRSLESQLLPAARIWVVTQRRRESIASGLDLTLLPQPPAQALAALVADADTACLWLLHARDQLVPHALLTLAVRRLEAPGAAAWYTDTECGEGHSGPAPLLYPDFNLDLFRSYPYFGRSFALELAAARQAEGVENAWGDAGALAWVFKLVETAGPQAIRRIPEVLLNTHRPTTAWARQDKVSASHTALLSEHLARLGRGAARVSSEQGIHTVDYLGEARPRVSIIMPTRDQFTILRTAVDSLLARTSYLNYELLIVDHDSQEAGAQAFLDGMARLGGRVKVLPWQGAFNYAAMVNAAAAQATGELLLLLDNDVEIVSDGWLAALVNHAVRPEVAAVCPRLELPDGRVDQAGLLLGLNGSVGAMLRGLDAQAPGYLHRLQATSNVTAASSSCLMVRKVVFDELGGFDAQAFPVYFGDVDFCLRAGRDGYQCVYTPQARLRHAGGATRLLHDRFGVPPKPTDAELDRFYERWGAALGADPASHPAAGRYDGRFSMDLSRARMPSAVLPGRPLPVVLAVNVNWTGCGNYRVIQPLQALERDLLAEGALKHVDFNLADVAQLQPDTVILQGIWNQDGIVEKMERARRVFGARILMDFDDYNFNIPVHNQHKKHFPKEAARKMRRSIEAADGLIVSTQPLAEEMSLFHPHVHVVHNRLDARDWLHLSSQRRTGRKVRVGWAGGSSHTGDLMVIRELVAALQDEVEWVFMGMKPQGVRSEFHTGVPFEQYPAKLASLNLDLAVVPLEINRFNECKSNLRLMELGILGVPIVCTDIEPYRCGLPVTRVRNRFKDWHDAVREHLNDRNASEQAGDALRQAVRDHWVLEGDNVMTWARAWLPAYHAA